jgi:hypothetical protein
MRWAVGRGAAGDGGAALLGVRGAQGGDGGQRRDRGQEPLVPVGNGHDEPLQIGGLPHRGATLRIGGVSQLARDPCFHRSQPANSSRARARTRTHPTTLVRNEAVPV